MIRVVQAGIIAIAMCFGASAAAEPPAGPSVAERWRSLLGMQHASAARIAVADVDGDARPDFIVTATSLTAGNAGLVVIGADENGVGIKQFAVTPDGSANSVRRVLAGLNDGAIHVYTVADDGTVRDFSGWPLTETQSYSAGADVHAAAVGDLLGDGHLALVVATATGLSAYDAGTGMPLWDAPIGSVPDIALAQLDDDPALEIIASDGTVIDGATQATDWNYLADFGAPLATGHLVGDASTQFVAANGGVFTVFRGTPWSSLWSAGNATYGIQALVTANLDGNQKDVIIEGDGQHGDIAGYDATTHQMRLSIAGGGYAVGALAAADIAGDAAPELAIAPTLASWIDGTSFNIVDLKSGALDWSYHPFDGTFSPVAIGDVDGDGNDELVVAGNMIFDYGTVAIFDARTGLLKWQSPWAIGNAGDPFWIATSRVLLVPHAGDAAMDIILAGSVVYSGRITIVNGATHAVRLQIGTYSGGPLESRAVIDVAPLDYDRDGTTDFVAATQPASGTANGALLQVFSGLDGHTLWSSVPMASDYGRINSVMVTGAASDPASELIAALPGGLRAYNIQTQLLDWTLLVVSDGAVYVPHGASGPEIAVFLNTGAVTFYDAATRAYLRSFTLDAPLNAIVFPDGDAGNLVAAAGGAMRLVDGLSGDVLASSLFLGEGLGAGNRLTAVARGPNLWETAAGTDLGVFRERIERTDRLFAADFDSPD